MGSTAGRAHKAGAKTADGIVAVGRQAGKLLEVPTMLSFLPTKRGAKKPVGQLPSHIEPQRNRITEPHAREDNRIYDLMPGELSLVFQDLQLYVQEVQAQAETARARIEVLEAELATARRDMGAAREQAAEVPPTVASELSALQAASQEAQAQAETARARIEVLEAELATVGREKEQLQFLLDQERAARRAEAEDARSLSEQSRTSPKEPAVQPGTETDGEVEVWESPPQAAEEDNSKPVGVTAEDVRVAVFASATEKFIFTKALSDMDVMSKGVATRAGAARAMGDIHHELSARALMAQFSRETEAEVRRECIHALMALGDREGLPVVEEALQDGEVSVRLAAVRAIYRLAGLDGASSIVRMLHDEDEDVRRRAATCLGWLGSQPLAVELIPLFRDRSAAVRRAALEAVGNLKASAVVDEVIELLDDPEGAIQREAFQVLRTITGKQMGETFPEDDHERKFVVARWRAWRESMGHH
jgi:hypothetical protein